MKETLSNLEAFVRNMVSQPAVGKENTVTLLEDIHERTIILQDKITDYITANQQNPNRDMIWFIQLSIVNLSDHVFASVAAVGNAADKAESTWLEIMSALEGILEFINKIFPHYFNPDCKIPDNLLRENRPRLTADGDKIADAFLRRFNLTHTAGMIRHYYHGFLVGKRAYTFRQIQYAEKLAENLIRALDDEFATETDVLETFIFLRFNRTEFMRHHKYLIREIVHADQPPPTRMSQLLLLRHTMEAIGESTTWIYRSSRRSPREEFIASLDEGIAILKHIEQEWRANAESKEVKYFSMNLTLRQLSHLVKIHILAGLTPHKNFSQLIALITAFVHPSGMDKVDPENARTKGLSPDKPTIQGLMDYLTKLVETLKEHYGEFLI
ncbi:MAG: hypothetical protein P0Y53_01270 [Candidatus Pseudobacter hemicellulosilyticus]|uniref:Uncharacterized protein n=1 Tax=Candidatus Pseudobacter hemicellulosilyticus TaxID=3121375 RepID=A0AAJ5WSZ5_9BACT|nr:MAG: hypothetical protein P0Y53_01270 [Pseudobacter sp.]